MLIHKLVMQLGLLSDVYTISSNDFFILSFLLFVWHRNCWQNHHVLIIANRCAVWYFVGFMLNIHILLSDLWIQGYYFLIVTVFRYMILKLLLQPCSLDALYVVKHWWSVKWSYLHSYWKDILRLAFWIRNAQPIVFVYRVKVMKAFILVWHYVNLYYRF